MNRRRIFLGLFSAAIAAPLLPAHARRPPSRAKTSIDPLLLSRLMEIVPDNPSSRRIGRALIDQSPAGFDRGQTFDFLFADMPRKRPVSVQHVRRHLDRMRRRDFADGKTVTAAGWILARSEADAIAVATAYRST